MRVRIIYKMIHETLKIYPDVGTLKTTVAYVARSRIVK